MSTVVVKNLKTDYVQEGTGPDVLLLHGWGSSYDVYKGVFRALSDSCRLTAVNFPGCGDTETMPEPWTNTDYCEFVEEFIEKTGLCNPVLIGHSHGGRVIMQLVGEGRLSPPKVVFLDAAGLIPQKTPRQKRRARRFKTIKKICLLPGIRRFSGGLLEKARKHYGSADYNAAPEVLRKTMVSLVNTDLRELLPAFHCPTLLIWGDKDTATPLADARVIEQLIPDAGLCVLEGCGHYSFCEKPAQAAAILRSFLP